MTLIKRVPDITCGTNEPANHANEIMNGPARVLLGRALATGDKSYGDVSKDLWTEFHKQGEQPLDLRTTARVLLEKFPGLERHIDSWKDKLCNLKARTMATDDVVIELVTTVDLPVDVGTPRRWAVDPLTAFLDMLPNCKGVIVENDSLSSRNGVPLVVCTIQRGNEAWLDDLAGLGFKFDGFRSVKEEGPQKHEAALEGMKQRVINVPQRGVLVNGTEPNQSLYDFGSVVRLTALDQVGNVIGVATIKPTNVHRTNFRRAGMNIRTEFTQGVDATSPLVNQDRVSLPTSFVIPKGQEARMLGLGADIPASMVRMDARIGAQTLTEGGAAIELEVSGTRILGTAIPFSHGANVNANEEAEALRVHRSVAGATYAEMMGQPAILYPNGTNKDGTIKGDGRAISKKVSDFALPERARMTIAGQALSKVPLNNEGFAIVAPQGVNYQDHLKSLGLDVVQEKIKGSTDQMFHVTVDPAFIGKGEDDKVRVGVGFYSPDGDWVWANAKGSASSEVDVRDLGRKPETFSVRVEDSVYRAGPDATPAKMYVRLWRGEGKTPLFLGAANFNMKEIGRTMGQLSTPEQIFERMEHAKAGFEAGVQTAASNGQVIGEPISAKEMEKRLANGGEWAFQYGGHAYTVKTDPTGQTQNHQIFRGDTIVANAADLVRTKSSDETLPNGYFAVNLTGIQNGHALYIGNDEIRRAPVALGVTNAEIPPRQARLETLTAKNADQKPTYPNLLWSGIDANGSRLNSREDLERYLTKQEGQRQEALRDMQRALSCDGDDGKGAQQQR